MASTDDTLKKLVNVAYNSLLIGGGATLSRMVTSKIGKDRPVKLDFKSVLMLSGDIAVSTALVGTLQDKGIIPKEIMT
jgi:hypothetical protein